MAGLAIISFTASKIAEMRVQRNQMEFAKRVGERVKALRLHASMIQKDVADKIDMHRETLYSIERDHTSVHITTLKHIADVLGRDIKDFF